MTFFHDFIEPFLFLLAWSLPMRYFIYRETTRKTKAVEARCMTAISALSAQQAQLNDPTTPLTLQRVSAPRG